MRVLLDEQLPRHLAREIGGHDVSTVQQRGWAGLKNGELLRVAADAGFEVLVTADRNLQFQQNLSQSRLGIILLVASSNALEDLLPLVPSLLAAIPKSRPAQLLRVEL
jgi:predicted nuclease of predicted toxin-antitoxin system